MSLRIIGGKFKGKILKSPKDIRPASSQFREAFFNICQTFIEDANFLDIFAGSGAMGIEAISRGASSATFIDKSKNSINAIKQNTKDLNLTACTKVIFADALMGLKRISRPFDIIFIAPPYIIFEKNPEYINLIISKIYEHNLLAKEGTLFIEETTHSKRVKEIENLSLTKSRRFGNTLLLSYSLAN